ncbi:MAG: hypothetical protein GXY41_03435 [Phycisphaerae bacterium]|nr:hypothetical protein [Phycisphaerae bacterium]
MNNLRAVLLGVFLAYFCVLPIISKAYDRYFYSALRQEIPFQEEISINYFSGEDLSGHYALRMCNILGLFSAVLFVILTVIVRLKGRHQVRVISDGSNVKGKLCHEKEPFLLRAATVWVLAILITAAIFVSIVCFSLLGK